MMARSNLSLWTVLTGFLAVSCVWATGQSATRMAQANVGIVHTVPIPPLKSRSGLQLTVDTRWVEGPGYRPVRVQIKAPKGSVADRTVTLRFRAGLRVEPGQSNVEVEQQIDIPAGVTVVDAVLAVPHYEPWRVISWDTWVDGRRSERLSAPRLAIRRAGGLQDGAHVPAVLAVGPTTPMLQALGELEHKLSLASGNPLRTGPTRATAGTTGRPMSEKFATVIAADLPTRWIDYSCVDIVCISGAEIRRCAAQQAAAWHAIVAWTRAGGNLWVYGVGDRWERLNEIEAATGLPPQPTDDPLDLPARGWQLPTGREPRGEFWSSANTSGSLRMFNRGPTRRSAPARPPHRDTEEPGFAWRDLQLGRVVVMQSDAPFAGVAVAPTGPVSSAATRAQAPASPVNLEWILGSTGPGRFRWENRFGLSTSLPTSDFWHFLIPGVGLAPVTAFHVLITLFVLVLGPLNYFLLYRRNRLHLLAVTVPLGALIVTSGLFAYALLADGLATRVRVRSLTMLDQRQGHAVRWSRLSYYAGLTPPAGLTFPADTLVLPLLPSEGSFYGGGSYQRLVGLTVEWDAKQHLTRGWLRARTPTQYVTVESSATNTTLRVLANQMPVRVENRLGADLPLLILADAQGQFHVATEVGQGATVALDPVVEADAIGQVRAVIAGAQLRLPPGMQTGGRRGVRTRRQNRFGVAQQANSRPERVLKSLTMTPATPGSGWRKRMYVAIVSPPAGIDLGVADAREEASLHVLAGRW